MNDRDELVVTRVFDATPARIWEAFTTPEQLSKFFAPAGSHVPLDSITLEPKVGGEFALTMVNDENGERYPMNAQYTAHEPPSLIAFATSGGIDGSIELEELGRGKTLLTWTTLADFGDDPGFRRDATIGTHSAVDQLGELLSG
jgi:uncharacterized protein YndB with AHSA1/START domain